MKKILQNEKDIIEFSNQLLKNYISFINKWDMEQCKSIYKFKSWKRTPNKDPEWVYMLNRMGDLNKLIIAFEITGKIEYINKYFQLIDSWRNNIFEYIVNENIFHNNISTKTKIKRKIIYLLKKYFNMQTIFINPIRTLDTSIRCFSLTNDFLYFKKINMINIDRENQLKKEIVTQINYIKNNYNKSYDTTNWGMLECIYSLYCLIVFEQVNSEIYCWNENKLKQLLKQQILNDGTQLEDTPLYHVQIFIALSHLINIMRIYKIEITTFIIDKYKKMADYIYNLSSPENNIINLGDSDITNISDIMYIAYFILNDEKFLERINDKLDISFLSRFIFKSSLEFDIFKQFNNTSKIIFFEDSKKVIISNSKCYLCVTNNDNISSHRHIDLGSFVYYTENTPILIDSGRYTYKYNKYRKYLKSQFAHNTLYMDNKKLAKTIDSWKINSFVEEANIDLLKENIIITKIKSKNVIYKRFFIILEEGFLIINKIENSKDNRKHFANRNYILNPNIMVQEYNNTYKMINNGKTIYIYTNSDIRKIKKSICSKKYNNIENNKKIILSNIFKNNSISFDCFLNKESNVKFEKNKCIINGKTILLEDNNVKIL